MRGLRMAGFLILALGLGCGSNGGGGNLHNGEGATGDLHAERLYTGEEILRGVLFGAGPVTKLVPEIWESAELKALQEKAKSNASRTELRSMIDTEFAALPEREPELDAKTIAAAKTMLERVQALTPSQRGTPSLAAQAKMQRLLIGLIRNADPTFFPRFGNEMQSGNPLRVDAAMHEATQRLLAASVQVAPHRPNGADCACGGSCGSCAGSCSGSCAGSPMSCSGQTSCSGQSCGQMSCSGQSAGNSSNWFYQDNYVAVQNIGVYQNLVGLQTAVGAITAAVIVKVFFWDPVGPGGSTKDDSGLAPDRTLERQMVVGAMAARLRA
jgi:hypothetical protein